MGQSKCDRSEDVRRSRRRGLVKGFCLEQEFKRLRYPRHTHAPSRQPICLGFSVVTALQKVCLQKDRQRDLTQEILTNDYSANVSTMSVQLLLRDRQLPSRIWSSASLTHTHRLPPLYPNSSRPSNVKVPLKLPPLQIGLVESLPVARFPWILESRSDSIESPSLHAHAGDVQAGSSQIYCIGHGPHFRLTDSCERELPFPLENRLISSRDSSLSHPKRQKPPEPYSSYAVMIGDILHGHPRLKLTLKEIYREIKSRFPDNFPDYDIDDNPTGGWRVSHPKRSPSNSVEYRTSRAFHQQMVQETVSYSCRCHSR